MSAEIARRKVMLRMSASPDKVYTDKITAKIVALEKSINSEVEFVNYPVNGKIAVKFANGDSYEFFNYQDPMREKRKPPGYKPPEIEYKKLTEIIEEDMQGGGGFGTFKFYIYLIFFAIFVLDIIIIWFMITQFQ